MINTFFCTLLLGVCEFILNAYKKIWEKEQGGLAKISEDAYWPYFHKTSVYTLCNSFIHSFI